MLREYTITWSMSFLAEDLVDAVRQAVGELKDPDITYSILRVDLPNDEMVFVEAKPIFNDDEVNQLEIVKVG